MYCRLGHLHTNPRLFFHDFCDASTCRENVSSRLESKLGAHSIHNICKFNWTVQCKLFNCCYTESIQEFTCDFHAEIQLNRFFRFRAEILHSESVTSASILSALSRHKSKCKSVQGASALSSLKKKWAPLSGSMEARIPRCQLTCSLKLVWNLNFGDQQIFYCGFRWIFFDRFYYRIVFIVSIEIFDRSYRSIDRNFRW